MIDAWGGWGLLQELLYELRVIAEKYQVSIGGIAVRWVMQQKGVKGVVVGEEDRAGMGMGGVVGGMGELKERSRVWGFELDEEDLERVEAVGMKSNSLFDALGDCGEELIREQQQVRE